MTCRSDIDIESGYNDGSRRLEFAVRVCFAEEAGRTSQCNGGSIGTTESICESRDELGSLSRSEEGRGIRSHNIIPIKVDEQCLSSD